MGVGLASVMDNSVTQEVRLNRLTDPIYMEEQYLVTAG